MIRFGDLSSQRALRNRGLLLPRGKVGNIHITYMCVPYIVKPPGE